MTIDKSQNQRTVFNPQIKMQQQSECNILNASHVPGKCKKLKDIKIFKQKFKNI
jgi:hypothetical protein